MMDGCEPLVFVLERLVEKPLEALGYECVQIVFFKKKRLHVQIMIDRLDLENVGLKDCEIASRTLAPLFDLEDPIKQTFSLEVSSPGLDRPLIKLKDFKRFAGHCVKLVTKSSHSGQKRFTCFVLNASEEEGVCFSIDGDTQEILVPLDGIQSCRLVPEILMGSA